MAVADSAVRRLVDVREQHDVDARGHPRDGCEGHGRHLQMLPQAVIGAVDAHLEVVARLLQPREAIRGGVALAAEVAGGMGCSHSERDNRM